MKYLLIVCLLFTGITTESCSRTTTTAMIVKANGKRKFKRMSRSKCQRKARRLAKSRHHLVKGYGIDP